MNREALYVLQAMAYRQKQMYESITTGAIFAFLYIAFGRDVFITICLVLVALAVVVFVIRFMVNLVRRLWKASEAIRDKLSGLFNLNVLYGCLAVYFMGSVIIYAIFDGIKSFLGMTA